MRRFDSYRGHHDRVVQRVASAGGSSLARFPVRKARRLCHYRPLEAPLSAWWTDELFLWRSRRSRSLSSSQLQWTHLAHRSAAGYRRTGGSSRHIGLASNEGRAAGVDGRVLSWHGEVVSGERRHNELVRTCAWCGRVYTGSSGWQREQRTIPPPATHSICPTCAVDYRPSEERPEPAG